MSTFELSADIRKVFGRKTKQLRAKGIVPGNIFGKKIKLSQGSDQNTLCRILFTHTRLLKEWPMDVIVKQFGKKGFEEKGAWRSPYYAAREINKKVATETGIKNLIEVSSKTVCINISRDA